MPQAALTVGHVGRLLVCGLVGQLLDVGGRAQLNVEVDQPVGDQVGDRVEALLADVVLPVVVQLEVLRLVVEPGQNVRRAPVSPPVPLEKRAAKNRPPHSNEKASGNGEDPTRPIMMKSDATDQDSSKLPSNATSTIGDDDTV